MIKEGELGIPGCSYEGVGSFSGSRVLDVPLLSRVEEDPHPCSQRDSLVDGKHVWTHPLSFCGHADLVIFVTSFLPDTTLCLSFRFFSVVPASSNLLILPEPCVENPQLPVKHCLFTPTHTNCALCPVSFPSCISVL